LFIATVDLTNPKIHLHVAAGGPDPDGPGRWQTTLMRPTEVGKREHFVLVINGDFFEARGVKDAEGTDATFHTSTWGKVLGPAVSDGKVWSTSSEKKPCLVVSKMGRVSIELRDRPDPDDQQVLAGNRMLVENGRMVSNSNTNRYPRTVAGLDAAGKKLIILVVDGRRRDVALGMSYKELSEEMIRLGCDRAINLDGGGSSVLAIRNASDGEFQLMNEPTDGHERAVANVLGVTVDR
jgi:exopolysaccharide biosynthesis protein